jgi:hypothetical protein
MPWAPEIATGSAYGARLDRLRERRAAIPFYDGLQQLEGDALLGSWAGEPDVADPRQGRVRGAAAFRAWVDASKRWLADVQASTRPVDLIVTARRTVEEVALDVTIDGGRRELPVAVVAERTDRGLLTAVRVYHSLWPLTGGHEVRAPLLARDPELRMPDVIGEYQRALAGGDLEAVLASYADDAVVREPAGGDYVYSGKQELRRIYGLQFANGGGISLEHCALTDDGRAGALEYNVVRWGRTAVTPQAGVAVYVRAPSGRLAAGRIYDDAEPPAASDSSAG